MASLEDQLHDEIDDSEARIELAHAAVGLVLRDRLIQLVNERGAQEALVALVELIEDDLVDLTTEAFRVGVSHARKRPEVDL